VNTLQPRTYRPSWFLRMYIRLDDFGQSDDSTSQDGAAPYQERRVSAEASAADIERKIAQQAAGGTRARGTMVALHAKGKRFKRPKPLVGGPAGDKSKGDEFSVEFITCPQEMGIEDKGYRDGAELVAAFPFQDMPLDPRIIRETHVGG